MSEHTERTSVEDVLQSSELAARLLRRLIASPGVIDTQRLFRTYARLTEMITHAHPLLHDLLARYTIDDDSTLQNLPLVADQPWMLNLNTYLTNNNSSSSSSSSSSWLSSSSLSSSSSPSTSTTNNSFFDSTSINQSILQSSTSSSTTSSSTNTYRITRRSGSRRESVPVHTEDDVLNPLPKSAQSVAHTSATVQPVIQRELREMEIKTSRLVLKESERTKYGRHSIKSNSVVVSQATNTPQIVSAVTGVPPTTTAPASAPAPAPASTPAPGSAPATVTASGAAAATPPTLPLAQEQFPAPQFQTRPAQFVWRKGADTETLRDFVTEVSSTTSIAAVRQAIDSLPVAQTPPPGAPVMKPESSFREEEPRSNEEITTEGMLRRISKMLLIERERRGY